MEDPSAALIRWLQRRDAATPIEVVETHVSVVAFQGDRAYKLKRAVRYPFVDLSTPERREADCRREVELNRRFAPDVYLGVVPMTDAAGDIVDHVVEMRRLPGARRLATLVRHGTDVRGCLERIADDLAAIHAGAPTGGAIDDAARAPAIAELWRAGTEQLAPFGPTVLSPAILACVDRLAMGFVQGRSALFDARVEAGRARDGHGDLLAQDVFCLDDGPRMIDCLEFDDDLRYGDVLADVAFLAMDLEHLGRADLALDLLESYRRRTGDHWPSSLADFYLAYRAFVRTKVACLRGATGDAGAQDEAVSYLSLAHRHLERARTRVVLVGGPPASGKSTVAAGLADATGWELLRSDVLRKEVAGLAPDAHVTAALDEGLYAPEMTSRVYDELLARARPALDRGESVVLDATWSDPVTRARAASLASECSAELVQLVCSAPADLRLRRAANRADRRDDPSDAGPQLVPALTQRFADWPGAAVVDTSGEVAAAIAAAAEVATADACSGRW
jgi:aminoglycoside phosphotransferase family enzyme/predicted kinase